VHEHGYGCDFVVEHMLAYASGGVRCCKRLMARLAFRRTLFGDAEECLTTLNAWQNMCEEARHFGRALFDAEELVLSTQRRKDEARQP